PGGACAAAHPDNPLPITGIPLVEFQESKPVPRVTHSAPAPANKKRSLLPLVLVFLCALAPIVAAFVMYYNPQWWPEESSNYGTLLDPQRPMPATQDLQ